jgi:hypothetical protein
MREDLLRHDRFRFHLLPYGAMRCAYCALRGLRVVQTFGSRVYTDQWVDVTKVTNPPSWVKRIHLKCADWPYVIIGTCAGNAASKTNGRN